MPTSRQERAVKKLVENGGKSVSRAMREAGYSPATAENPKKLTGSKSWQELMEKYLPDEKLAKTHERLLGAKVLDHMVFPLGPIGEDDENLSGSKPNADNALEKSGMKVERTTLTDKEIVKMLADVGCQVKRIVHAQQARHVYFWTDNTKAQYDATQMAYKLKGYLKDVAEVGVRQLGDVLDDLEDDTGAQAKEALDTPASE